MAEIDDVEQAEDDCQPQAQQRVEGPVDQPDEELTEQGLGGDAEERQGRSYFFTSGQPPWSIGRKACSAGIVARIL